MSTRLPGKLLQAQRVRDELEEYLSRFDLELRLQSPPRHLDPIAVVCTLLLEKLVRISGGTVETNALAARIEALVSRGIALWKQPTKCPLRLVTS